MLICLRFHCLISCGMESIFMLDLPFVFCNSAHCYTEAVFFIFDVYELKISLILIVLSFLCIASVFLLLFVFQLCFFFLYKCVFSLIVKVHVGFLKA